MSSTVGWTAGEIAAAVHRGEVTPREVVRDHLEVIDRIDPVVGAFVQVRGDQALTEAEELAAHPELGRLPLAGVPVAVKGNTAVLGEATRFGCAVTDATPARDDHEVVVRLRAAGAIVVGVTRMPELGVWGTTDDAGGVTRNPWQLDRTAGGSSGGAAAAVASGMVPVAQGNDGMGSIRIPAAACGVVGVKPGGGLVPADIGATAWRGLAENGPLTTTVADAALVLSVMSGRRELAAVAPPAGALRIAASTRVPVAGVRLDTEVVRAVVRVAGVLRRAGHAVVRADPPYSQALANAIAAWFAAAASDDILGVGEGFAKLEARQRHHARLGRQLERWGRVRESDRQLWTARAGEFFRDHDVLITPVTTGPPLPAEPGGTRWGERSWLANFSANLRWAPFAGAWNFAGFPALTVPAAMHSSGVPIGVQLVAPLGGEDVLLSVAAQWESSSPWQRFAPMAGLS